jgi:hypothetical protein
MRNPQPDRHGIRDHPPPIGFAGLLLTDDLDMAALRGPVPDRAARSLAAGCDIALNCWAKMDDMIGIARPARDPAEGAARLARAGGPMCRADPERSRAAGRSAMRCWRLPNGPERPTPRPFSDPALGHAGQATARLGDEQCALS